jgi:hypothetical protein
MNPIDESLVATLTASHGPFLKLVSQTQTTPDGPIITVFQWNETNPTLKAYLRTQLDAEKDAYPYHQAQGWFPLVDFEGYVPAENSPTAHAAFVVFVGVELGGVVAILPHDAVKAIDSTLTDDIERQYGPFLSGLPDTDEHNPDAKVVALAKAGRDFIFNELDEGNADLLTGKPAEGVTTLLGAPFEIEEEFTYNGREVVIATFQPGCDGESTEVPAA